MYVENANRAVRSGNITPDNMEPNPKNPIIASFFRNIGRADRLGSGVRNLFTYSRYYSGKEPVLVEDDIFRIIVPLDDEFSYDKMISDSAEAIKSDKKAIKSDKITMDYKMCLENNEEKIIMFLEKHPVITNSIAREVIGMSSDATRKVLKKMVDDNLLVAVGEKKSRKYFLAN